MIHARLTPETLIAIPLEVRKALDLKAGDFVGYDIENGAAVLKKINPNDPFENPFATFTEWADELDTEAFRDL
ncbi:MAG: AbrB/MazE/SpoVT family DNA-binding domain-containing protein [Proteobacteria bacterium]|nr:AbrB/MazE/SpoVT family DNA-binding domain-containing protein [Pseudomonadota bacterium]